MNMPTVNSQHVARGNRKLKEAIDEAIHTIESPLLLAYFFSITPARGRALWRKFRAFQRENGPDYTFGDYVVNMVDMEPITRAFMPESCRRPHREAFRSDMRKLIDSLEHFSTQIVDGIYLQSLSEDQILPAFLEEVFFGRGEVYELVRKHHCVTCPHKDCAHHV